MAAKSAGPRPYSPEFSVRSGLALAGGSEGPAMRRDRGLRPKLLSETRPAMAGESASGMLGSVAWLALRLRVNGEPRDLQPTFPKPAVSLIERYPGRERAKTPSAAQRPTPKEVESASPEKQPQQ